MDDSGELVTPQWLIHQHSCVRLVIQSCIFKFCLCVWVANKYVGRCYCLRNLRNGWAEHSFACVGVNVQCDCWLLKSLLLMCQELSLFMVCQTICHNSVTKKCTIVILSELFRNHSAALLAQLQNVISVIAFGTAIEISSIHLSWRTFHFITCSASHSLFR